MLNIDKMMIELCKLQFQSHTKYQNVVKPHNASLIKAIFQPN